MQTVSPITNVRYERAAVDFADGSRIRVKENDLDIILTRTKTEVFAGKIRESKPYFVGEELGLDTECNYLIVGMDWNTEGVGRVVLPSNVPQATAGACEKDAYDYDRVAYLDAAIETLQRARAVLSMARPSESVSA